MMFHFETKEPQKSPWIETEILNTWECGVAAVGITLTGKLCYRRSGALFPQTTIDKVIFLQSKTRKGYKFNNSVTAEFDIYTTDDRVIEVSSCDRKVIEAALAFAPVYDIRASYRAARGVKRK